MSESTSIDWAAELRRAEKTFGPVPRRFNWFRRLALRISRPGWLTDPTARPELQAVIAMQDEVWRDGELVWGAVITADDAVLRPGVDDLPVVVLYSFDTQAAANLLGLVQTAGQLATLVTQENLSESPSFLAPRPAPNRGTPATTPHALPILQEVMQPTAGDHVSPRARLKANLAQPVRYEIPKVFTAGQTMFATTVIARRLHLPLRRITNGYFPLLVRRDEPVALILPCRYWPTTVLEDWRQGS